MTNGWARDQQNPPPMKARCFRCNAPLPAWWQEALCLACAWRLEA